MFSLQETTYMASLKIIIIKGETSLLEPLGTGLDLKQASLFHQPPYSKKINNITRVLFKAKKFVRAYHLLRKR